jgi:hypothetical protein
MPGQRPYSSQPFIIALGAENSMLICIFYK